MNDERTVRDILLEIAQVDAKLQKLLYELYRMFDKKSK